MSKLQSFVRNYKAKSAAKGHLKTLFSLGYTVLIYDLCVVVIGIGVVILGLTATEYDKLPIITLIITSLVGILFLFTGIIGVRLANKRITLSDKPL